jgi:hypothetical protein
MRTTPSTLFFMAANLGATNAQGKQAMGRLELRPQTVRCLSLGNGDPWDGGVGGNKVGGRG